MLLFETVKNLIFWIEEYGQYSPNKNQSPNLWHVTSILVCCIFVVDLKNMGWNIYKTSTYNRNLRVSLVGIETKELRGVYVRNFPSRLKLLRLICWQKKYKYFYCLIILFQVNEKQRRPGESRALFYFERDDQKQNSLLDDISEFLKPSVSLSELDILPLKATTTTEKKFFGNGTSSELKVCPMIPPNLHGAVKVVRT